MSAVWGLIHCRPLKLKLNKTSLIEAEVARLSDYVPFNISIRLFME